MNAPRRSCVLPRLAALVLFSAIAFLASPSLVPAGSTGTALHKPQGSGSGTDAGDYVSDASALNAPYRYFIEVPPGLSRLQVQILDADVGLGGMAEVTAGRDSNRSVFNTAAAYTLIDPDGIARPARFTAGNVIRPAGSDNAWLDLYNATGNDVRDDFGTASFGNDDGNRSWSGGWIETDGGGAGPTTGAIQVTGGELRLQDDVPGAPQVQREADLLGTPGLDMGMAFLSFTYRTSGDLDSTDQVSVQVSGNGGASWTSLETFTNDGSGSRSYDITAFIADDTRVRFLLADGFFTGSESFYVDYVRISDGPVTAGHWELRVDLSSNVTAGDDVNAIGIRAGDGDVSAGGTELNVYADSHVQIGVNPPSSGTATRSYTLHPYVTSGCSCARNDFDYDSNRGNTGSMSFTSRSGSFTRSYASTALSTDNVWRRDSMTGWTSDADATDYGVWTGTFSISSYLVSGIATGNHAGVYMTGSQAAANPPTANPTPGSFRIYLPTDAGAAPVKPYMTQQLRYGSGPNPPQVGQTTTVTVTVGVVNPASRPIAFSASNLVTANVPGGVIYGGGAQVSQGAIVSQPAVGETGDVTWNPGTLSAGAGALLSYEVSVTPASSGQRIAITNGTRAQYVDETGNATQPRATQLFGPLCDLAVTQGLLTRAVLSSFQVSAGEGVLVEWATASETGTAGFLLSRWDPASRRWLRLHDGLLPGLIHELQGGTYRFLDESAAPGIPLTYLLEEVEASGRRQRFGPFTTSAVTADGELRAGDGYERTPHPAVRRTAAPLEKKATFASTGEGVHLAVRETGLYYLSTAQVVAWLGLTHENAEKDVARGRLLLTRDGLPVAWYPDLIDGLRGRPKTARGLFFYGEASDSLYNRDTVYRLEQSNAGLVMQSAFVTPSTPMSEASFPASLHVETDAFPATAISPDPESDYWFWAFLVAGDPSFGRRAFTVDAPGLAAGPGTIAVDLQGATDTHTPGEHRAALSVNGIALGEIQWQGIAPRQETFAVPAGALKPAGNQVEVTASVGGGAPYSVFYVDGFRLGYPRTYSAVGDALAFTGEKTVTLTGFSSPVVRLLDISDPRRPIWLTGGAVSFVPSASARYLAVGPGGLKQPASVRPWSATDLRSPSHRAEVLIVVPPGFESAAERLADLRRGQGLESLVVTLDEVADGFGHGAMTPHVLQSFLAWAWQRWDVPPRYVVLAGEGSLDYRNLLGYGDGLMPPRMVRGEGGLHPADNRLADATGDGRPDMAIGRIPVRTAAELNGYVDKILAYESTGDPAWAANVLLLADRPDGAADFAADSDRIAALLPAGYEVDRIDLASTALEPARVALFEGLDRGAALVNFLGHGGLDRLSGSGLLTSADVGSLTNGARLPVLTAMTCMINRYDVPGIPSLGELLVKSPLGGAAAAWAPSGLAVHGESRQLAEQLYRLVPEPDGSRLGDLVLRALAEFDRLGGDGGSTDVYNLLGDPSLLVRGRR